ncbi:ribonuclease M5 [Aneurinibacillus sp. Ricciae_BoGa-3]|uniref:ribonuclease M5 n=1 Tax=Aneurinibacillus sp. Ricciae_BoGa-3 TaxID=3022697 RepID=UPI00234036AB|nr:ribonuclease M5 [Aneurinibacillus sp. Ricciae_BoGa-3]WCK54619.1 ribonuclease M5 [Aneurinibacillus sp. Ricciae_BoGa-3]
MIKEIIVVEGKSDTVAIKRAVQADTIETGGSAISGRVLDRIRRAQQTRGVIIFTDPDFQGERIRKIVSQHVPGCKHAFIKRDEGRGKRNLGVEYATDEAIRRALAEVRTEADAPEEQITMDDLIEAGLVGGAQARDRRFRLGEKLGIGYANAKQLHKRLLMLKVSREEFAASLAWLEAQEENK